MSTFDQGPSSLADLLLEKATPDLFRLNAFRITALTADATPREISRQAKVLQMKAKLEGTAFVSAAELPFDNPPDLEAIRAAAHALQDTEQRFLHEIFWIWPTTRQPPENLKLFAELDPESEDASTIGLHNRAVTAAVRAIDLEFECARGVILSEDDRQKLWGFWQESADNWQSVLRCDVFWEVIEARARDLEDPRLTSASVTQLRNALPQFFAKIHAIQAFRSGERQGRGIATQHAAWARQFAPSHAEQTLLQASTVFRDKIAAICLRLEAASEHSVEDTPNAVRSSIGEVTPLLGIVSAALGTENVVTRNLSDRFAEAANGCLVDYCNASKDWATGVQLLEKVRPMAHNSTLIEKIESNLNTARRNSWNVLYFDPLAEKMNAIGNADLPASIKFTRIKTEVLPLYKRLQDELGDEEPVVLASQMVATLLRSVSIDLHNNDENYDLALDAIALAVVICLDDELAQKLEADRKTAEQHALEHRIIRASKPVTSAPKPINTLPGQATVRPAATSVQGSSKKSNDKGAKTGFFVTSLGGVFLLAVLILFFWLAGTTISSAPKQATTDNQATSESRASQEATPSQAAAPEPAERSWAVQSATPGEIAAVAVPPKIIEVRPTTPPSVPDNSNDLEQKIESGRAQLAQMKSEVDNIDQQLNSMKSSLEEKKSAITSFESQMQIGNEIDHEAYTQLITEHNDLVRQYNSLLADRREKVREYNVLVSELNGKIRQHNRATAGQ
jgi:Skp family chaperone for outer membrane proteins